MGETRSYGGNCFLSKASTEINAEPYFKKFVKFSEMFMYPKNNFNLLGFTKEINNKIFEL
jgi:hypothetical protein